MQKILMVALVSLVCLFPVGALADGNSVGSTDLIENAQEYDGQRIVYTGEAIGDVLIRGNYAWVNISDGNNAIGCWMTAAETGKIHHLGSYKMLGDTVRVTGVFHRACAEHGGDLDIHADTVDVAQSGYSRSIPVSPVKAVAATVMFSGAVVFMAYLRKARAK